MTSRLLTTALAAALTAGSLTWLTAPPAQARTAPPSTDLTLQVRGCDGCSLRLTQAIDGRRKVWQSRARTVEDGSVAWSVPTGARTG